MLKRRACLFFLAYSLGLTSVYADASSLNLSRDLVSLGIASQNLAPDSPSLDARPLFEAGLQYVKNHHIPLLTVDRGSYYFLTPASGTMDRYTNIFQVSDLTIDLAGSTVYFKDPFLEGFSVTECQRVTLTNFRTDFINPPYTHVQLTSIDATGRRFFYQTLPSWVDPATFSGSATRPELWAVVFRNGAIVPGTSRMQVVDPIASGVLQLVQAQTPWTQAATLSTLQPGDTLVVTERGGLSPILAFRGDSIVLSNITVYGSSSWAVDMESTTNSIADHIRVMPRPGTGLIGSNADGIHFSSARQNNHIRNSYVTRTLDDAIAIDSLAIGTVLSQGGPRQLHVKRSSRVRFPNGTPVNFVDVITTAELTGASIVSQDPPDTLFPTFEGEVDLTFDQDLPSLAPGTELVFGSADLRGSGSSIEDNMVEDILFGRGMWISGNEGVTVQRNSIGHTSNGGIVLSQDTKAYPGPPARDVVIQSNTVIGSVGPMASGTGTQIAVGGIIVESTDNTFSFGHGSVNSNITIRSNYVADSGRAGIWVGELNGGTIQDNLIIRWNRHPELPTWGMCCADLALVQADFSQPLAVHFSTSINSVNNVTQLASSLTGPVGFQTASAHVAGQASVGTVTVQSNVTGFSWIAYSDSSWLTIGTPTGSGTAVLTYSVTPNRTGVARHGTIVVAGQTFVVTQDGLSVVVNDFDGDGKTDITVYRPSNGTWYILTSNTGFTGGAGYAWGANTDVPVPGDYDGDGQTDIAVYQPSTANWVILKSSTNYTTSLTYQWGTSGDLAVPGDYDGDGKTDLAIYRPSNGTWYILTSSSGFTSGFGYGWGVSTDIPVPDDYDGDGKTDVVVYRPSSGHWFILKSSTNYTTSITYQWGTSGDLAVPGDYDGDGKTDLAIYRPSTGTWYILTSSSGFTSGFGYAWGVSTDVPVLGDYDGDGKTDVAVYRPSTGNWFILKSSTNYTTWGTYQWGTTGDLPILKHP